MKETYNSQIRLKKRHKNYEIDFKSYTRLSQPKISENDRQTRQKHLEY